MLKYCVALVALLGVIVLSGCDDSLVDLDKNDLAGVNLEPGIHRREASLGDGETLRYTTSVPQLTFGKKYPLVIALHGNPGGVIPHYYSETYLRALVQPALGELNAIIVAPDMPDNAHSWIDKYSDEAISEFIKKVLKLERSWPVDPERIVITGYSAGGFGVWSLTDKHPSLFSAAIPMAAEPILGDREGPNAVPLYVIHGTEDELFPYDTVVFAVNLLKDKGVPITMVTAEGESHTQIFAYVNELRSAIDWLEDDIWKTGK
jgi:predicted peptidase